MTVRILPVDLSFPEWLWNLRASLIRTGRHFVLEARSTAFWHSLYSEGIAPRVSALLAWCNGEDEDTGECSLADWLWLAAALPMALALNCWASLQRREGGCRLRLLKEDTGQDIAEYAVMIAVILVIVVGTVRLIGSNANNVFSTVASAMQ
jgi:Flp pilus assembly pilin Flp